MRILYSNWVPAGGERLRRNRPRPDSPSSLIGVEDLGERQAVAGKVVFQKSNTVEKWSWIGIGAVVIIATLWMTFAVYQKAIAPFFINDPLSLFEVIAFLVAFAMSAVAVLSAFVLCAIAMLLALVFTIRKWNWGGFSPET